MKIIILAGGTGTRLWPLSRTEYPKQFLKLGNHQTLFHQTFLRALKLTRASDIFVLTNPSYAHMIKGEMDESQILFEPAQRNTAPAIAYALKYLMEKEGGKKDEVLFISPSDHVMDSETGFCEAVQRAEMAARNGAIVTFGIKPSCAEVGYGYIEAGEDLEGIYRVNRFVEKPDLKTAEKYVESGDYFWNSGMFVFQIGTMLEELKAHSPEIFSFMQQPWDLFLESFEKMPEISIDYAVMEKTERAVVLPLSLSWSDVGSWDKVYDLLPKDAYQNAKVGQIVDIDTKNSLIFGDQRLIATMGVENMVIVETSDAIFIGKKEESQRIKEMIVQLKMRARKEVKEHVTTHRPWGTFTVLDVGARYKIKKIAVYAGQTLSLQFHHHRSEHWVIVKGTAKVTIGDQETFVHENESIYVPKGALHRVHNPGKIPLEIIETQVGEYLGEDDIIRLEDIYGRENRCVSAPS